MQQMDTFARDDVFPSWFANALGRALSVLASNFQLVKTDNTHVQLAAGANDQAAVLSVGGQWRWVEASITVAHPGGVAGTYPMFATASNNNIQATPDPYTDDTNYAFNLEILAVGATPAIVAGTVDVYRHVADVGWDGAKITHVNQLTPGSPLHAGRHAIGGSDPLTPADIGAIPTADPSSAQPGDFIVSGALTRTGAVLCDGRALARVGTYAALFAAIGTRYGAGDGSTTFNVPDLRDRVVVGAGGAYVAGATGGENTHTLTNAEMPTHSHSGATGATDINHTHGATGGQSADHSHGGSTSTDDAITNAAYYAPIIADSNIFSGKTGTTGTDWSASAHSIGWVASQLAHAHTVTTGGSSNDHTHGTGFMDRANPHSHTISADGGSSAHNNMQKYVAASVFIKY